MDIALTIVATICFSLIYMAGYATCYFFGQKRPYRSARETILEVPRRKPSLKSPLRTYAVKYERYKARDSDLYQPSKPKRETG